MRNIIKCSFFCLVTSILSVNQAISQIKFTKSDSLINFLSAEEWVWIGSSGGFSGNDSTTPQSAKLFKKINFQKLLNYSDSLGYKIFENGILKYEGNTEVSYSESIYGKQWNLENIKSFTVVKQSILNINDSIISLSDNCYDCYSHEFKRKSRVDTLQLVTNIVTIEPNIILKQDAETVRIDNTNRQISKLGIFSLLGQKLYLLSQPGTDIVISKQYLSQGINILTVDINNKTITVKIIK